MKKDNIFSSTKWESSFYGGYKGLIIDHPDVHTGMDVEYDIHRHKDLSYYTGSKLIDIFLVKSKEYHLIPALSTDPEIVTRKGFWGLGDNKFAVCNKDAQRLVLEQLIQQEKEYRSLFLHYTETILTTDIMVKIPPPEEESSGGGGSDSAEDGEENDKESKKAKPKDKKETPEQLKRRIEKILSGTLGETKKRERPQTPNISGDLKRNTTWQYPKGSPTIKPFTTEQERNAKTLVQLLDINFDPSIDRLNSLRAGKFDQRKVGEVIAGNLNIYYKVEPNQTTKPFSVVILVDESGSMGGKMKCAIDVVKTMYLAFSEILPKNKLSIYGHSGGYHPEIYVYKDPYHDNFNNSIETMRAKGENYDGPVIEAIYDKVREYTEDNIIFIVLSDGEPCGSCYGGKRDVDNLKRIVEKCRRDGFVTIGVGIYHDTRHLYDYNCIVNSLGPEMVKKTSYIINSVVKTEFQ